MVFSATRTICKGLHSMSTGLKVSFPLIANMVLFVDISNFSKWKFIYIMTIA